MMFHFQNEVSHFPLPQGAGVDQSNYESFTDTIASVVSSDDVEDQTDSNIAIIANVLGNTADLLEGGNVSISNDVRVLT